MFLCGWEYISWIWVEIKYVKFDTCIVEEEQKVIYYGEKVAQTAHDSEILVTMLSGFGVCDMQLNSGL